MSEPQTNSYHITKLLVVHDGAVSYLTEFGSIFSNTTLSTFNSDINSGNLRLLATPKSANVVLKINRLNLVV